MVPLELYSSTGFSPSPQGVVRKRIIVAPGTDRLQSLVVDVGVSVPLIRGYFVLAPVGNRGSLCRRVFVQCIGRIGLAHTGIHDRSAVARFIQIIRDTPRRGRAQCIGHQVRTARGKRRTTERMTAWAHWRRRADVVGVILGHIRVGQPALIRQRRNAGCRVGRDVHRAVVTVTRQCAPGRRDPAVRGRDTPACVLRVKDDRPCRCCVHFYRQRARAAAALGNDNVRAFTRYGRGCGRWRWSGWLASWYPKLAHSGTLALLVQRIVGKIVSVSAVKN